MNQLRKFIKNAQKNNYGQELGNTATSLITHQEEVGQISRFSFNIDF